MSGPTPEQVAKLPKWAQDYIGRLVVKAAQAEEWAEFYRQDTEPDTSRAVVGDYVRGNRGISMDDYSRIVLFPKGRGGDLEDQTIELTFVEGEIEVRSGWSYQLAVKPRSGNVIRLVNVGA